MTLDGYCERPRIDRIDFLKLGIQGWQIAALDGTTGLLQRGHVGAGYVEGHVRRAVRTTRDTEDASTQPLRSVYSSVFARTFQVATVHSRPSTALAT